MGILNKGLVSRPPRLRVKGAVWGTDFVLSDQELLEHCESFALTYVELTVLTRDDFFKNLAKHESHCPELLQSVRYHCCWLAFQRALTKEAIRRRKLLQAWVSEGPEHSRMSAVF